MTSTPTTATWTTNTTLEELGAWLAEQSSVVLLTHSKPDGDAIGSTLALARALNQRAATTGVESVAECWYGGPTPGWFKHLTGSTKTRVVEPGQPVPGVLEPSAIVVCDTGSWNQLEPFSAWLRERADRCAVIDHHLQGDADAGGRRLIDSAAAAVCEPVAELCRLVLGLGSISELPADIADPLLLGIATDTGWFRHSNVSPRVHSISGQLLEAGADQARLYELIQMRDHPARLRLMAKALAGLELHPEKQLALMTLTSADFKATGAAPGDSGGFVDLPQSVASIRVVALLTEQADPDGVVTKISLRSKPGEWDGQPEVDVNQVCGQLGGGGHARAAGARVKGTLDEAKARLIEALP